MIGTYFTYTLLGLSLSLPAGAMTVEMTKQGLKNGFFHGWFVGIGGMTIDLALIISIYLGFSSFLSHPPIQLIMWGIGFLFLLYIGCDSIRNAGADIAIGGEKAKRSFFKSYINGFMIAISPANLVFWLGIFGTVLAASIGKAHGAAFILIAAGILTGIMIHDIGLLSFVHVTRKFVNKSIIAWVSVIAGIVLIGFSTYFGFHFLIELKQVI